MKNYLGLATGPHDPSLAIVDKTGTLVYAEGTERPLQTKRAWGCAPDHINFIEKLHSQYCDPHLETVAALTWSKASTRKYSFLLPYVRYKLRRAKEQDRRSLLTFNYMGLAHRAVQDMTTAGLGFALDEKKPRITTKYFDHHLTHAATAAYSSSFDDGVCAVIDGFGESSSIAAYEFRGGQLRQIKAVGAPRGSLGFFYALMCDTCGFDPLKGEEWKVMGLAAYGKFNRQIYDLIRPLIVVDGVSIRTGRNLAKQYDALFDMRRKEHVPAIHYADFAATAQWVFTETVQALLRELYAFGISDNLILSGGCALNSSTNGTLIGGTPFKRLFVGSAPADDGNSVGAAYLAYLSENPYVKRSDGVLSPYLGSHIKSVALENLKRHGGLRFEQHDEATLCTAVAKSLADGKIVGWAQGRAEFGPRALGNRSILADPRQVGIKDRINAEVKFREEFRPFAPSVLHEHGEAYFENYQFSPYMERTLKFKDSVRGLVPGVVHIDGTGRLQSVTEQLNPRYYRLIKEFHSITGIPLLLNTSFNVMGKPIVHSVEDAAAVFHTSGLDVLVVDNTVFFKADKAQSTSSKSYSQEIEYV